MNRSVRCSLFLMSALALTLGLSGCVANRAYREMPPVPQSPAPAPSELALCPEVPPDETATAAKGSTESTREKGPVLHEQVKDKDGDEVYKYSLAFVEFDDLGEMFTRPSEICKDRQGIQHNYTELGQTLTEIARLNSIAEAPNSEAPNPVFVLFIHGWKNNASESSGNVQGFRSVLQSLAQKYRKSPIMGIYIGWRGAVTNLPVVKEFSFWNRKNAASRIPGAHLTEAIRSITLAARSNSRAKLVVVGHSFGGLVLERTLTQAMVELILENKDDLERVGNRLPNLTVLLNEAGPATESKEFLNFLQREHIIYTDDHGKDYPFFLSLTSTGDWATHIVFPVGQFLGKSSLSTRKYDEQDEFGETDQNNYYLHTTANSAHLTNHTVTTSRCVHVLYTTVELGGKTYYVCDDPRSKQNTPYWAMQIPTEFIPDHSTIFKPELRVLLEEFMSPHLAPPSSGVSAAISVPAMLSESAVTPPPSQPSRIKLGKRSSK